MHIMERRVAARLAGKGLTCASFRKKVSKSGIISAHPDEMKLFHFCSSVSRGKLSKYLAIFSRIVLSVSVGRALRLLKLSRAEIRG